MFLYSYLGGTCSPPLGGRGGDGGGHGGWGSRGRGRHALQCHAIEYVKHHKSSGASPESSGATPRGAVVRLSAWHPWLPAPAHGARRRQVSLNSRKRLEKGDRMKKSRLVRFVFLSLVLTGSVVASGIVPGPPPPPPPPPPCPPDQCAYGTGCYTDGACLNCQRCHTSTSGTNPPQWFDDNTCKGCKT
jgi:hypothetical protein